jgi:hypothetical protein
VLGMNFEFKLQVIGHSLGSKTIPYMETMSICDLVSVTKLLVGFPCNSILQFFTKQCHTSVKFNEGWLSDSIYFGACVSFHLYFVYFFCDLVDLVTA